MVSGYLTLHLANERGYPFQKTIESLARVCDEVVVLITEESRDGTEEAVRALGLSAVRIERVSLPGVPAWDGALKEEAHRRCRGDVVIQMDADEFFHPHSVSQARWIARHPEFWGTNCLGSIQFDFIGPDRGRYGSKWRFFKNDGSWQHGVPPSDRGPNGTAIATDGCFPYDLQTGRVLEFPLGSLPVPGFWPLVMHTGGSDPFLKMKRSRDGLADAWDRLRAGGKSVESTFLGECRGKTDEELREMADEWLARETASTVPAPEL